MISGIALILISFFTALFFTTRVRQILIHKNLLDHPNERSSHAVPVPRGGGWAVLFVVVPGMMIEGLKQENFLVHCGLIAGVLILAAISWLDDKKHVSARARLSLHLLAACLGSLCLPPDATLFEGALPFFLDRAIMIIGWAWFINLYNFMDGIDGITGVETISIATGTCLLMTAASLTDPFVSSLTCLLTGAALGFLALNWHPAKIFLGDIGSVPLGYLTGYCLISLAVQGYVVAALILPLYYLADSGITIAKRALRHEKIWQAHREHYYQRAAQAFRRHDRVVYRIIIANIALIFAAVRALNHPFAGLFLGIVIVALLLWNMHKSAHADPAP